MEVAEPLAYLLFNFMNLSRLKLNIIPASKYFPSINRQRVCTDGYAFILQNKNNLLSLTEINSSVTPFFNFEFTVDFT